MVIRQRPSARPPLVRRLCDDPERHVGAGFGRRLSISRRISANSRRGIATSTSWNVTSRPCRTTLAPISEPSHPSVDDLFEFAETAGEEVQPMAIVHDRPGTARRFAFETRGHIARQEAISGRSIPVLKMCRAVRRGASFLLSGWPSAEARGELGNDPVLVQTVHHRARTCAALPTSG